jgi:beta-lactamase class A
VAGRRAAGVRPKRIPRIAALVALALACAAGCSRDEQAPREACPDLTHSWNGELQEALAAALEATGDVRAIRSQQLAVAVVDISDVRRPRLAAFNPTQVFVGASAPKLGVLFAALVQIDRGALALDVSAREVIRRIARRSSNVDATWLFDRIGGSRVAWSLAAEPHRLYHPESGGGLFATRSGDASLGGEQRALADVVHGASALQAARFYHLLACGATFSPELTAEIPALLAMPGLASSTPPGGEIAPGTATGFHADTGIVLRNDARYIIAALARQPLGEAWLLRIVGAVDDMLGSFETAGVRPPGPTKF